VVHPFKAQIGHTLGASGALELLACADALIRGIHPAAAGEGDVDPDARVLLLDVARQGTPRTALKLSAAFGGANAALVLSRDAHAGKAGAMPRAVYLGRAAHIAELPSPEALAARIAAPVERVLRADGIARWALAAVAALAERDGPLCPAGVIVGTPFATMETNALFHARITERGARMAEPRRFPYTSPNAAPGEVGVAFGLKGPSFAVGCGAHAAVEALVVAAQLVRGGDAEAIVVVAADDVGSHVSRAAEAMGVTPRSGGVAILVTADRGRAVAEVRSARCGFGSLPAVAQVTCGHLPLLPLVGALALPRELSVRSPDPIHEGADGWARVELAAI
jgi:3-oxoacyl-[acyl-carrier-protein] synthase-1/3-oxoacyl-[acyl-carrier-protein] synthase II